MKETYTCIFFSYHPKNQKTLLTGIMSLLSIVTGNSSFSFQSEYIAKRLNSRRYSPFGLVKDLQLCCNNLERLQSPCTTHTIPEIDMKEDAFVLFTAKILGQHHEEDERDLSEKRQSSHCLPCKSDDLNILLRFLSNILKDPYFDISVTEEIDNNVKHCLTQLDTFEKKLESVHLVKGRLKLCTIGSLVQLISKVKDEPKRPTKSQKQGLKETIIVIDESGCIPSYELLSLSQLKVNIAGIIVVGDKHQLPPYDPGSDMKTRRKRGKSSISSKGLTRGRVVKQSDKLRSILDVSRPSQGKVNLTTQYRVPRDIANMLNQCIYSGKYNTPMYAIVPEFGFKFLHVPYCENQRKYVNKNEIQVTLKLIERNVQEGKTSIMVLTPVSMSLIFIDYEDELSLIICI
jgi:hypothetical protein